MVDSIGLIKFGFDVSYSIAINYYGVDHSGLNAFFYTLTRCRTSK